MIDIHCHILPGIDDGAGSEQESCMMARMALDDGVTAVAATPHCNVPGRFSNYAGETLAEQFHSLRRLLRDHEIPLPVYTGMEVFVTRDYPRLLRQGRLLPLGSSSYMLLEFAFDESPVFMEHMLQTTLDCGCVPVIAHPERYYCTQDERELLFVWAEKGCVIQLNKGSFFGLFGRRAARTAHWCLEEGCVHLVGSDAHSPYQRTTRLASALDHIARYDSPAIAKFLLEDNPGRILSGKPVQPVFMAF